MLEWFRRRRRMKTWRRVYRLMGMSFKSGEAIFIGPSPDYWYIYVLLGVTPRKVIDAFEKLGVTVVCSFAVSGLENNFDVDAVGTYRACFCPRISPDPELAGKNADTLKTEGVIGVTFIECLLFELRYLVDTGRLESDVGWTLCSGTRMKDGRVLMVGKSGGKLVISHCNPCDRPLNSLCARRAIARTTAKE